MRMGQLIDSSVHSSLVFEVNGKVVTEFGNCEDIQKITSTF